MTVSRSLAGPRSTLQPSPVHSFTRLLARVSSARRQASPQLRRFRQEHRTNLNPQDEPPRGKVVSIFANSDKVVLCCGVMAAKIRVVMKSFTSQSNKISGLMPYTKKVGLPESRSLYTVLRSPHIDKKSREQFSMHIKKQFVEQRAELHELHKKLFWLKRLRVPGAQYEVQISFKTRLDKGSLKSLAP